MNNSKGFTLIELMVVIVIIGILAAAAIPKFAVASQKAKVSEAPTVLTQVYTAETSFQAETSHFTESPDSLGVTVPASNWFEYDFTTINADNFTYAATVSGINGFTSADGLSINQEGEKAILGNSDKFKAMLPNWKTKK